MSFHCHRCGRHHEGPPLSYGAPAPAYWSDEFANDERSFLEQERCVIAMEHFFVRARIVIPLNDSDDEFDWGVWVSLSRANMERSDALWSTPGRESEPPYFGWLSTVIPIYEPATLNLKANIYTQPVGERPLVLVEPTDHPLALDQRNGMNRDRVRQIAEAMLHHDTGA